MGGEQRPEEEGGINREDVRFHFNLRQKSNRAIVERKNQNANLSGTLRILKCIEDQQIWAISGCAGEDGRP